jgi:hypothetical protein
VLGVGGAAAIAEKEDLAAPFQGVGHKARRGHHLLGLLRDDPALEKIGLRHGFGQACGQRHAASGDLVKTYFNYKKNYIKIKLFDPGRSAAGDQ